ncbi:family 16 glycosylhydrolase [Streptomyces sp. NPDC001288]|uniref:family 16 glycosylhydrolase n=1 Tax=unclassified Streptomyces TaxID=2593676 RepID=UPI00332E01FE
MRARRNRVLAGMVALAATALTIALPAAQSDAAADAIGAPVPDANLYTEQWRDEFSTIDTSQWSYRTDARLHSCNEPRVVSSDGSHLVIAPVFDKTDTTCSQNTDSNDLHWIGGGLISKEKFRYGYYETRVQVNKVPGWHNAFWTMCGNTTIGNACRNTEIDGFEIESSAPTQMRHNIFDWSDNGNEVTSGMYDSGIDTSAGWHTYGFLYDESGVTYYVDGQPVPAKGSVQQGGKLAYPATGHPGDPMNVWLTNIAFQVPPTTAASQGQTLFDYFSYAQKDRYIDNDDDADTAASGTYAESGPGWAKSGLAGFAKSTSRYSCTAGSSAQWSTKDLPPGQYTPWIYTVSDSGSDPAAQLTYSNAGGVQVQTTLNQKTTPTGWHQIGGTFALGTGTQTVKLAYSGSGCLRADAVKFVRTG